LRGSIAVSPLPSKRGTPFQTQAMEGGWGSTAHRLPRSCECGGRKPEVGKRGAIIVEQKVERYKRSMEWGRKVHRLPRNCECGG